MSLIRRRDPAPKPRGAVGAAGDAPCRSSRARIARVYFGQTIEPECAGLVTNILIPAALAGLWAITGAKQALDPDFVIMARCDLGGVPGASFAEIIERCHAYKADAQVDWGADYHNRRSSRARRLGPGKTVRHLLSHDRRPSFARPGNREGSNPASASGESPASLNFGGASHRDRGGVSCIRALWTMIGGRSNDGVREAWPYRPRLDAVRQAAPRHGQRWFTTSSTPSSGGGAFSWAVPDCRTQAIDNVIGNRSLYWIGLLDRRWRQFPIVVKSFLVSIQDDRGWQPR